MPTVPLPPDMPANMRRLHRDRAGRPVPWFVPMVNGEPDFRLMTPEKMIQAIRAQLCFICGTRLHRVHGSTAPRGTFVLGPMCVVNRTGAEPPNHADCAHWSAKACPFLNNPGKLRRTGGLDQLEVDDAAGIPILRNPGVTALVDADAWRVYPVRQPGANDGLLFEFSRITNVSWVCQGRKATSAEVLDSVESGLPELIAVAEDELGALPVLARRTRDMLRWVEGDRPPLDDYPVINGILGELVS